MNVQRRALALVTAAILLAPSCLDARQGAVHAVADARDDDTVTNDSGAPRDTAPRADAAGTVDTTTAPPFACERLTRTGDLVALPREAGTFVPSADVVPLGDGRAAVVGPVYVPGVGPQRTVAYVVAWTGAWPPETLDPVTLTERTGFLVADTPGGPTTVGLLGGPAVHGLGAELHFGQLQGGGLLTVASTSDRAVRPAFIAGDGDGTFFVGSDVRVGDGFEEVYAPEVGWYSAGTTPGFRGPWELDCPSHRSSASAVALSGGWLLARGLFAGCGDASSHIVVTRYDGVTAQAGTDLPSGPYSPVHLEAAVGGAWLVHTGTNITVAQRLSPSGAAVDDPVVLGAATPFVEADAAEDGLAFVTKDPDSDDLVVAVMGGDGVITASARLELPERAQWHRVSFDVESRQALVALGYQPFAPELDGASIHLARFSCE